MEKMKKVCFYGPYEICNQWDLPGRNIDSSPAVYCWQPKEIFQTLLFEECDRLNNVIILNVSFFGDRDSLKKHELFINTNDLFIDGPKKCECLSLEEVINFVNKSKCEEIEIFEVCYGKPLLYPKELVINLITEWMGRYNLTGFMNIPCENDYCR